MLRTDLRKFNSETSKSHYYDLVKKTDLRKQYRVFNFYPNLKIMSITTDREKVNQSQEKISEKSTTYLLALNLSGMYV